MRIVTSNYIMFHKSQTLLDSRKNMNFRNIISVSRIININYYMYHHYDEVFS